MFSLIPFLVTQLLATIGGDFPANVWFSHSIFLFLCARPRQFHCNNNKINNRKPYCNTRTKLGRGTDEINSKILKQRRGTHIQLRFIAGNRINRTVINILRRKIKLKKSTVIKFVYVPVQWNCRNFLAAI